MARPRVVRRPSSSPVLLVLAAVVSVQFGGAVAATLLPLIGVTGSVSLRLVVSAVVLLLAARPTLRGHAPRDWRAVVGFGLALAVMNTAFYASLTRLPIGVAVTVEFVGPLVLSAALSRRRRDAGAILAAGVGVVLISHVLDADWAAVDVVGLGFALLAGGAWAGYIVMSSRVGACFPGLDGLALALAVAAVVVTPFGVATAGGRLLAADALARGGAVALLSSLLPYSLELFALRRLDAEVFGILLSLEPAVAALAGLLVLGQTLSGVQIMGMALVVLASVAVTRRGARPAPPAGPAEVG